LSCGQYGREGEREQPAKSIFWSNPPHRAAGGQRYRLKNDDIVELADEVSGLGAIAAGGAAGGGAGSSRFDVRLEE